jgi:hypothetical protein
MSKGVTDQDGNYRVTGLPAGNYLVAPIEPSFVVAEMNSFGQRGKSLIMSEGENVEGLDFSMVRGGVITGKVSFSDGRPVIEERVNVFPAEQPERPGPMMQTGSSVTDDRGVYRVFGLPAGRYKISIGQGSGAPFGVVSPGRPAYEPVFFPDVTNSDEAKVVELESGTEATNIDITVGQILTRFAAKGVVVDGESNQPLANLRLGLQTLAGERTIGFISLPALSNRLGEFRFENLIPGKYLVVMMPQNNDMRADPVGFAVVDQNITGLVVKTSRGASISGTVVFEGSIDKTVPGKMAQLLLQAYVRNETGSPSFGYSSNINPDGTFRIGGLQAGVAQLQLGAQDRALLTGFTLARVERGGVVVGPRTIEVKSGEQISGLRIVVIFGSGIIHGTIKVENGPLPTSARLSVGLGKPGDPLSMRSGEIDARGRFVLQGVPAGTYELFANVFIPGLRGRQPFTRQSITVSEGSVMDVELVVDLVAPSAPLR